MSRNRRLRLLSLGGVVCILFSVEVNGADLAKLSHAAFRGFSSELDKTEKLEHAVYATGEISIARKCIEDGGLLLRDGRVRKAAIIAERLPIQLELIRVLVAAAGVLEEAKNVELETVQLERELLRLKTKYDRLSLQFYGKGASGSVPPTGAGK
jgi:hypothetical protein